MPEIVRLNDGTEYNASISETRDALYVILESGLLEPYFTKFNNPENTIKITYVNWGTETEYTGYNHLFWIKEEPSGNVTVGLVRV